MFSFLAEQIQGVRAIIDEVEAGAIGDDSQTEEAAGSGRCPSVVYQLFGDLGTAGRCFYDSAVVAVRNQNIPVGSDGETERVVNRAVGGDIIAGMSGGIARQRMRDGSDAVVQAVRDIAGSVRSEKPEPMTVVPCRLGMPLPWFGTSRLMRRTVP